MLDHSLFFLCTDLGLEQLLLWGHLQSGGRSPHTHSCVNVSVWTSEDMVLSFICVSVCVREMDCGWHTCRFMPGSVVYHMCVNLCTCVRTQAFVSYLQRHTGTEHTDIRKPYRSQHRHTVYSDKQTHTPLLSSGIFIQLNERKCAFYCIVYACVFLSVCVCLRFMCLYVGRSCV